MQEFLHVSESGRSRLANLNHLARFKKRRFDRLVAPKALLLARMFRLQLARQVKAVLRKKMKRKTKELHDNLSTAMMLNTAICSQNFLCECVFFWVYLPTEFNWISKSKHAIIQLLTGILGGG